MIDIVLCSSYDIRWRNMSPTRSTFGAKFSTINNAFTDGDIFYDPNFLCLPEKVFFAKDITVSDEALLLEWFVAMSAFEAFRMPRVV